MSDTPYPGRQAREPLLSDEEIRFIADDEAEDSGIEDGNGFAAMQDTGRAVRDWYEAKIASGELRAYKRLGVRLTDKGTLCNNCNEWQNIAYHRFCAFCGEPLYFG